MRSNRNTTEQEYSSYDDLLEKLLYDFESSWFKNQGARIRDFLPKSNHPRHQEILVELIRAHMELSQESGEPLSAQEYFEQFDDIDFEESSRRAIVFEEFRQTCMRDGNASLQSIGFKYDLDFSGYESDGKTRSEIKFPETGSQVGEFNLIGVLGDGAYGRVFLAQQKQLEDRLVVLKFTHQTTVEHRLLARMQHTNIVPIHSVHEFSDLRAICMPLLGIVTLRDLLKQSQQPGHGRLDNALIQTVMKSKEDTVIDSISDQKSADRFLERHNFSNGNHSSIRRSFANRKGVIEITKKIADGLGYAHLRGIVHGDLKPANILIGDDGEPIILDFHLGRSLNGNIGNLVGGTVPYMSPEQLRSFDNESSQPNPHYDVYAAGALILELLTGKPPFVDSISDCKSLAEIARIKSSRYLPNDDVRRTVEPDLLAIVAKCLEPDPACRFQNGSELASELQRCLNYQPLEIAHRGSFSNRIRKWSKRHPNLSSVSFVSTAATCLIGFLIFGILLLNHRLNVVSATTASNERIEAASTLRPSLAAAFDGRMDESAFKISIDTAKSLIELYPWSSLNELEDFASSNSLTDEQLDLERLSAAEIHFWLSELFSRAPMTPDNLERQKFLEQARVHNRIAQNIWPEQSSRLALKKQASRLASEEIEISNAQPNNFEDRLLWTFLTDIPLKEKQEIYESLAKEKNDHFVSWLLLANACSKQGKPQKAIAYYDVCQSIDPNSHIPSLLQGIENLRQGNNSLALANLDQAESLAPDDITVLLNLGLALGKNRKFEQALEKYDRAIELGAHQTRTFYLRSRLKSALGDERGAEQDHQHFMESEPLDELSCITRGVRLLDIDPKRAIADYERALQFNPRSATALNNLANAYSEVLNDNKTAVGYLDQAIECQPENAVLFASRAVLNARMGKAQEAIEDSNKAISLKRTGNIYYRVAGAYAQLSKLDQKYIGPAIRYLAKAAFDEPATVLRLNRNDLDILPIVENSAYKDLFSNLLKMKESLRSE